MKRMRLYGLAILLMVMLAVGCAGPGAVTRLSVTMPNGQKGTIVAHNQMVPDWMLSRDKLALNYMVKGDVSDKQLAAIAKTEETCRIFTGIARPNNLVAVLSQGVLYAAAGYIGIGLGAKALAGVNYNDYAVYGASASGIAGLANGFVTLGGQTYTFENCGQNWLGMFPEYNVRIIQKSPY